MDSRIHETSKIYQRLMANYIPPQLQAPIVCLTAKGSSRAVEFDWKPWRRLSPTVTARRSLEPTCPASQHMLDSFGEEHG